MPSSKNKVLILGDKGMLGHMVKMYLQQFYEIETINHRFPSQQFEDSIKASSAGFLINCIGAIPQRTKDFSINYELPIWLDSNFSGNIIHPGTDCEMDDDDYGNSKRIAAEWIINHGTRTKIIKGSIVGPEVGGSASLLYWFLSNEDGSQVNGFTDHMWNGVTTLQWAEHSKKMIDEWNTFLDRTVIGSECNSKFTLLNIFNEVYSRNITINPFQSSRPVNKCLPLDVDYGDFKAMVKRMKDFYDSKA